MKNWQEIHSIATSQIATSRNQAMFEGQIALNNILQKHPLIKELYNERKGLVSKIARAEIENKDSVILKEKYKELGKKLKTQLDKENIKKDDILPTYNCTICRDKGSVKGVTCVCYTNLVKSMQYDNSQISEKTLPSFKTANFDIIKDERQKNQNIKTYETMQKIIYNINDKKHHTILIIGNTGTGKTHLVGCITKEAIEKGLHTISLSSFMFNQKMLEVHCKGAFEKEKALQPYLECDVLIIDDMGSENLVRNVTTEYLYSLLDERRRNNKLTIITTNLTFQNLRDIYDERIFSRIASNDSLKIQMIGDDLRLNISAN